MLVADECASGDSLSEFFSVFIIHLAGIPKDLCVQVGTILNLGAIDIANKSANGAIERVTFPERLVIRYIGLVMIIEGTDRTTFYHTPVHLQVTVVYVVIIDGTAYDAACEATSTHGAVLHIGVLYDGRAFGMADDNAHIEIACHGGILHDESLDCGIACAAEKSTIVRFF